MTSRRPSSAALCTLLALVACAHGVDGPGAASSPSSAGPGARVPSARYFPLAVGNHWTYDATYLGERSVREVTIVAFQDGSYVDRDGRQLRVDREGLRDQTRYLLHEPLVAGATWTSVVGPGAAEHYTVLSVGRPCSAPAGRWPDCVEVESRARADDRRTLVNRVTFAAGVGIVHVRTELEQGGRASPQAELSLRAVEVAPLPR